VRAASAGGIEHLFLRESGAVEAAIEHDADLLYTAAVKRFGTVATFELCPGAACLRKALFTRSLAMRQPVPE